MKYILKPSLEHMALVKIGISLWNQNDIGALIAKLRYVDLYPNEWKEIEERVVNKVPQLPIPTFLKGKVFGVIKPIGTQILEWMRYYREYDVCMEFHCLDLDLLSQLLAELCWTPEDIVDRKRTAEVLVRNQNLNVSRCYILACDFFLEDDIIHFWSRVPEDLKDYDWDDFPVLSFWTGNMKNGGTVHISYKELFHSSVSESNKVAAKYFLQKLTPQEREEYLKELGLYLKKADLLCFLLNEMEEEEVTEVFKYNSYKVLHCFLQWPWQNFFMEVANCMWDSLSMDNYDEVLVEIIDKVREGYKDFSYQNLFREFWQKSPHALKDSFIEEIDNSWLLQNLCDMKDKENIRHILKNATLTAKSKIIYSVEIKDYLTGFIRENEWDFLEFFIRECVPSKTAMLKFKEEFEKHRVPCSFKQHFSTKKHIWDQLFHYSVDSICDSD